MNYFKNIWFFNFDSALAFSALQTSPRKTATFELEFYPGDDAVSVIDGLRYPHPKDTLLFIRPGQTRYSVGRFNCIAFHFDCDNAEYIDKVLSFLPTSCYLPDVKEDLTKNVSLHFSNSSAYELFAESVIQSVISKILESYPIPSADYVSDRFKLIKDVSDYIKENWQEKIFPNELAKKFNMSRSSLFCNFKSVTGFSPCEYAVVIKLEHAKALLVGTDRSIADISTVCGFCSQSYFNFMFKKSFGITPLKFRKEKAMAF